MTLAEQYLARYGTDAARTLAQDLMRGDPATFKAGYTRENAVIAVTEVLNLTEQEAADLRDDLGGEVT